MLLQKQNHKKKNTLLFLQGYSLLLIIGGIFAHETHATAAMIASVLSGMVVQVGFWLAWKGKKYALPFNLITLLGLSLFFIYRWFLIRKFYPPVVLLMIALLLAFKVYRSFIELTPQEKSSS